MEDTEVKVKEYTYLPKYTFTYLCKGVLKAVGNFTTFIFHEHECLQKFMRLSSSVRVMLFSKVELLNPSLSNIIARRNLPTAPSTWTYCNLRHHRIQT